MPRYSKQFVNSVLLLMVPSLALYPQADISITSIQTHETSQKPLQIDSLLSYDDVLNLINDLETGELEKRCSQIDLERINHFLVNLALQGILPNEVEEEFVLQNDIHELLHGEDNPYEYSFSLSQRNDYVLVPSIFYGQERIIPCKGWFSKKIDKTVRFVKKHKEAIIIGTAIVVGVGVVIGVAAAVSSAAPVAAGVVTAGSDKGKKDKSTPKEEQSLVPASTPSASSSSTMDIASGAPTLKAAMDEQVSSFKETLVKEQFFQSSNQGFPWEENGRTLGSLFAHESLNNLEHQLSAQPRLAREIQDLGSMYSFPIPRGNNGTSIEFGHPEIDRMFSTDYTHLYTNPGQEVDFNTLSYQVRGERAIAYGYYNQAVHDLGKVIETNPTNPIPYLERGFAHFGLGEYDRSLEDYRQFTSQSPKTNPLFVSEFSLGFAKGLPKGIYESGEGIFLFLADFATHPIHTAGQMVDSVTQLVNLVRNDEWGIVAEALSPEMHQLVTQWDTLPSEKRGELAGYALGKHGADILTPGALAKVASKSVKSAQELASICKNIQRAEGTLILETAAGLGSSAKIAEVVEVGQQTAFFAEEFGYNGRQIGQLKQAGKLEITVANNYEHLSPSMQESIAQHKKARDALKPYSKKTMPEEKVRTYIHETGIPTFPRPKGVPEDFLVMISDKGAGMEYVHPTNTHIRVRVMPGKPHSPFPYQQKPYVIQKVDGKALDKIGNRISPDAPEAHIPLEEFIYCGK